MNIEIRAMQTQVSPRALLGRINRHLAPDSERMFKARDWQTDLTYGAYYIVDGNNAVLSSSIELEDYGRDCGSLRPNERLADV